MFGNATRRRNRRRPEGRRRFSIALPKFNWRRWGGIAAALASLGGALLLIRFALDQPIEKVAIEGRFQRVSPLDIEKAVRDDSGMIFKKLFWKAGNSFQIITTRKTGNRPASMQQMKVVWNLND